MATKKKDKKKDKKPTEKKVPMNIFERRKKLIDNNSGFGDQLYAYIRIVRSHVYWTQVS